MSVTTVQAGIILSLIISSAVAFAFAILARKTPVFAMLGSYTMGFVIFTFLGWFPTWTGAVLAIIFAALAAKSVGGF